MKEFNLPFCRIGFTFDDSFEIVSKEESLQAGINYNDVHFVLSKIYNGVKRYIPFYKGELTSSYGNMDVEITINVHNHIIDFEKAGYKCNHRIEHEYIDEDDDGYLFDSEFSLFYDCHPPLSVSYSLKKDNKCYLYIETSGVFTIVEEPSQEELNDIYSIYENCIDLYSRWDDEIGYQDFKMGVYYIKKGKNPYYYLFGTDKHGEYHHHLKVHPRCKVICAKAFDDGSLSIATFPKGLKRIEARAFSSCNELEKIILPEGLTFLGRSAFEYCAKVSVVKLPSTIKRIDRYCFDNLYNLDSIIYNGTKEMWSKIKKDPYWLFGSLDFNLVFKDGKEHIVMKQRYCTYDKKGDRFTKEYVDDEIKEIISLAMPDKIKRARGMFEGFLRALSSSYEFNEEQINTIIFGTARLFISMSGGFKKVYYDRFLKITGVDISYKDFEKLMTKESHLEEDAFDIVTCDLGVSKRFLTVITGAALVSHNKTLSWKVRKLIRNISFSV